MNMNERSLHTKDFERSGIKELLRETNLLDIMSKLPPLNLLKDMGNPTSPNFQQTIVRGHTFEFFHSIINQHLDCPNIPDNEIEVPEIDPMVSVITRGKVRTWPCKYNFRSSHLTSKYFILHKISMCN